MFLCVILPGMVGGSLQPTCDFTWAIEKLSACGSVPPTHSLLGRAVPLTIRCVGLLRSACSDDSMSVYGECVLACKVRVCEFNARTTHPVWFSWNCKEKYIECQPEVW